MRISIVILFCLSLSGTSFTGEKQVVSKEKGDTLVGVNYFAGWWKELPNKWHGQGWSIKDPDWRPSNPSRVPLLGEYNTQATIDKEIVAAAAHGIDFFMILYYFPKPGSPETKHAPRLNRGLETFIASKKAGKMKFCIEYCNHGNFSAGNDKEWNECVSTWVAAMKHPSYLRVDSRLVFKVHNITQFLKSNSNDWALCRKRLDTLRNATRKAGLGEIIIGCGISAETPTLGKKWPPAEIFDFTGTYMSVPKIEPQKRDYPFSRVAKQRKSSLKKRVSDPIPWLPYVAAGWNPRPWAHPKGAPHHRTFFAFPTRKEFTAELKATEDALSKNPSLGLPRRDGTRQKAFTIYAWNEFGEGGIVAPTKGRGYMMLECINDIFGANAKSTKDAIKYQVEQSVARDADKRRP